MFSSKALPILMMGGIALAGCNRDRPDTNTTKTTTETTTTQVGSTLASTTETKVDTAHGDTKSVTNTYVGTVTVFEVGKSIEVMTGNKDVHAFALDGKNDMLVIDPSVAVGSKVQLVEEKGAEGFHKIAVSIAPPA
jgi:hypothetical protein